MISTETKNDQVKPVKAPLTIKEEKGLPPVKRTPPMPPVKQPQKKDINKTKND